MNVSLKKMVAVSLFGAALVGCSTAYAHDHKNTLTWVDTTAGKVLADMKGMTLYTFDKDKKGRSNCYGGCASLWPPAIAKAADKETKNYSKVKRKDGTYQWAYKGQPLYTWENDVKSGDIGGDGIKGVWHIITKSTEYSY